MAMFTKKEAVAFLADKWGVKRVEERLLTDRKNLIDEIVVLVHINVNFQTVTLLAVPPSERRRPTVAEIKRDGMSGVGGNCYCVNVFTWGLLKGNI
ncbi:hypothetical protein BaRGS_00021499 [Batillaria attramentaria]|uniref:Uncharacterized protein n=1 Tax=Batillaria attramentaria TaxID=370345 RepID=A0ABD0KJ55_9CAEN